jgi:hypothetical protein
MLNSAPHKLLLTMLFAMAMSFIALAASFAEMPPHADGVEVAKGQLR